MTPSRFLLLFVVFPFTATAQFVGRLNESIPLQEPILFNGETVPYRVHDKWGFIDPSGRVVVEPQFDSLWNVRGMMGIVAGRGEKGVVFYDEDLRPLFAEPVKDISALNESYYDRSAESELYAYITALSESNQVEVLSRPARYGAPAWQCGLRGGYVDSVYSVITADSTFVTVDCADGRRLHFAEPKNKYLWVLSPWYVTTEEQSERRLYDLRTGESFTDNGLITYFVHGGKEYRIVPQGTDDWADDKAAMWKHSEKYDFYRLTDASGKELRRYEGKPSYSNGIIVEKHYHAESNTYEGYKAEYLGGFLPVDDGFFAGCERSYDGFLQLTKQDGSFLYFHPSGKLLYRGQPGEDAWYMLTATDTLLCVGTQRGFDLMTFSGKELFRMERGGISFYPGEENYRKLYYGDTQTDSVRYGVYHPYDTSFDVLHYSEIHVLQHGHIVLTKDSLYYRVADEYDNFLDTLFVSSVEWIPAGSKGIVVGGVPEKSKRELRRRQAEIGRKKAEAEYRYLSEFKSTPWKRVYFDERLRELTFPEEYDLYPTEMEGVVFYSAPSKPGFYGLLQTDGTILLPNDYRWIHVVGESTFMVYDGNGLVGYVRSDGTKLFE